MNAMPGKYLGAIYQRLKTRAPDLKWERILSFAFATLVPLLVFTAVALGRPISFDGAMNLQVASNLAEHGEYSRNYAYANSSVEEKESNTRFFPNEVETNGPYILVAALGIKIFGHSQLGYQFANVVFIIGIAAIIWWMLRRWFVLAAVAPPVVLLLLPHTFDTALGGYGEVPALFFAILAIAFVAHAVTLQEKKSTLTYISFALVAAGAAIVTKTYLVGFVPALLLGIVLLKYAKTLTWKSLIFHAPYVAVVPILHEIWHLVSIGSAYQYFMWWKSQLRAVLFQSGIKKSDNPALVDQTNSLWDKVTGQIDIFTNVVSLLPLLLLFTGLIAALIILLLAYGNKQKLTTLWQKARTEYGLLVIMLGAMFATYFAWWTVLLPAAKTFTRRTLPATLPLEIVLALLIAIGFQVLFVYKLSHKNGPRSQKTSTAGKAVFVLLIVVLGICLVGPLKDVYERTQRVPYITISDYQHTVGVVQDIPDGTRVYGLNWWSSPVISLMADRSFYNLDNANVCQLDPQTSIIVWDKIASAITKSETPTMKKVDYELYRVTDAATLYRVHPNVEFCSQFR